MITDRKEGKGGVAYGNYTYFEAVTVTATDYLPFGMTIPGRSVSIDTYRYGMNGQEKDVELGNSIFTAEYWEYDARIGRRWNLDPVVLPWESPYATFNNSPIFLPDPSGASTQDPAPKKPDPVGEPIVLPEVIVVAKRPDWQPKSYGEIKVAYRKQVQEDFASDKRQQGWYGQSPPQKYMENLADAQLKAYFRQQWINGKFGAGKIEHFVPIWASGKEAYYMAQIDDLDYKAGAAIHVVLAVSDFIAIESLVKNVAQRAMTRTITLGVRSFGSDRALGTAAGYIAGYKNVLGKGGKIAYEDIVMHGSDFRKFTFVEFDQFLTSKGYDGKPLRLWICSGGADQQFIQSLANKRGVNIIASDGIIDVTRGSFSVRNRGAFYVKAPE